jgi:hypothetical protein
VDVGYDLLIAIRCHKDVQFTMDTYDSLVYNSGPYTKVVFAVDREPKFAKQLAAQVGEENVYCSTYKWGWGIGLYCLMLETILWAEQKFSFQHFMSADYDAYFIAKGADKAMLNLITSDRVGLVGQYIVRNPHWATVFQKEYPLRFKAAFGKVPHRYILGEGVQGGCFMITRQMIETMKLKKMFSPPWTEANKYTGIADDHFVSIVSRMCELEIVDAGAAGITWCQWRVTINPCGLEKRGYKIFHPTKLMSAGSTSDRSAEIKVRNHFRRQRGREPLQG